MNHFDTFKAALADAYRDLFKSDPEYAYSASRNTPDELAKKMAIGLQRGSAHNAGKGVKRACKAVGIKSTYKAIGEYLSS